MKICMYSIDAVFQQTTGGVRRFFELMNALVASDYDVTLFSADTTETIQTYGLKGRTIYDTKHKIDRTVLKEIKKSRFNRVVVFDVRAAYRLALSGIDNMILFLRQDLYLYRQLSLEDRKANPVYRTLFLKSIVFFESLCLWKARKIVLQCKFDLNNLEKRHIFLAWKIKHKSVIQINNVNPSWVTNRMKKDVGTETGTDNIYDLVFVGNFKDKRKGHDILLPALKQLVEEGFRVESAIIGGGEQLVKYQNLYGKTAGIHFLGRMDDPIQIIQEARLMVVPSYVDSCPNAVMEGLYYNIAVIGANSSGIPEILNNSKWLFELNIEEMKKAIRTALATEVNQNLRKEQWQRRSELMFDWGKTMVKIVEEG